VRLITTEHRAKSVAEWIERYTIMEDCESHVVGESVSLWRWCSSKAAEMASLEGLSSMPTPQGFPDGIDSLDARLADISGGTPTIDASEFEDLRISLGIPGAATEYSVPVNPLELRLAAPAISFAKGCYIGQEVLSRMDSYDKVSRYLMGWTSRDESIRVSSESRFMSDDKRVGRITSATADGARGLAILNRDVASPRVLTLRTDASEWEVELVDLPFWS
ncbi:MAG: tRNA-modifying protein YgfZ, partial [Myxococcota bacterium]